MATAEIAPVVLSASQTSPGVGTAFTTEPQGQKYPMQGFVTPLAGAEVPAAIEIAIEVHGEKYTVTPLGEIPSARPTNSVLFAGSLGPKLRLKTAIPLEVAVEEEHVVLTWAETSDFASGKSTGEALDNFGQSIRELYVHLHSSEVALGSDLLRVRDVLDRYIAQR